MKNKIHKKMKLKTSIKYGIIIGILAIAAYIGFRLVRELTSDKVIQEEHTLYQYTLQPKADYLVHIKENIVYDGTIQGEGLEYSRNLLDYIEVNFSTEYQSSDIAELQLEYQINAYVNGYKYINDGKAINWSKLFPLTDKRRVAVSDSYLYEEAKVEFGLDDYEAFATEAKMVTGMNISTEVVVCMEGTLSIVTPNGNLSTPVASSISLPILESIFTINKSGVDPVNDMIVDQVDVTVPINYKLVTLFAVLFFICIIAIIILLLITEAPGTYDILIAKSRKLIKNYGSRMIAIHNKPEQKFRQTYELNSINDLIKISDEIQKPIFYQYDEISIIEDFMLHVIDGDNLYLYHIY
ncbi:hypothetical protein H0486_06190 [Lachnospiraceae bacterium MD1]|uniref:DUF5305 domain-containing protein n=1 Tax=Variimorphobacter saccharofermentans TaxID=2755051 RepID=A0A839JYM4_9FIRM|nr:DUF5305 family protein [Variimorphobacter saccharofermentans]MBB2182464.1 hypothetical protein [Variimorphobacter saccharofermentans]